MHNPQCATTVYPKKYAHGFVVLCFAVVMQSFIKMNSYEVFIHIHQGCFAGTGAIVRLPQCQWSKPVGSGKISQCITTTKHSKANTVCIFLGIYCIAICICYWQNTPTVTHHIAKKLKLTICQCYMTKLSITITVYRLPLLLVGGRHDWWKNDIFSEVYFGHMWLLNWGPMLYYSMGFKCWVAEHIETTFSMRNNYRGKLSRLTLKWAHAPLVYYHPLYVFFWI